MKSTTAISRGKMPQPEIKYHADGLPILFGRLVSVCWYESKADGGLETQCAIIEVTCQTCRQRNGRPAKHRHGWVPGVDRPDAIQHRASHCHTIPAVTAGYYIAIDPTADHIVDPAIKVTRPGRAARKRKLLEQLTAVRARRESEVAS